MKIFLHDGLVDEADARISVFDHGLLYGDGIFEGIRVYDGCVFRLRKHLERLYSCARYIFLEIPMSIDQMEKATVDTVVANNIQSGYIRLVVTRGEGELGLLPFSCKKPGVFIIASQIKLYPPEVYQNGMRLGTLSTRRMGVDMLNPRVKSLNYLNNILAKVEAKKAGFDEALLLDSRGFVCEASADNVFIVKDGILRTPPAAVGALKGITRDFVIELAGEIGVEVREEMFTRFELMEAEEAFLTGTGAEIVPVRELDGRLIGGVGKPGPVTKKMMSMFRERVRIDGTQCYPRGYQGEPAKQLVGAANGYGGH